MAKLPKNLGPVLEAYRTDPVGFMVNFLDVKPGHVWPKMEEICTSVVNHQRTVVKAGHSVSKTYTAARLVLWFLFTHYPKATVVTTAPGSNQVEGVLWREIREAWESSRVHLGGEMTLTKLDLGAKWFAIGFATKADTVTQQATRFHGWHNDYVLVLFDEAAAIMPQIWEAADTLLIEPQHRFLAIGNPTSPVGEFVNCFDNELYHPVTISVLDTPNYQQDKKVIPGLAGRAFEKRYRERYGIESPIYKSRVLGEIPEYAEGIILGREMSKLKRDGRVTEVPYDPAYQVYTCWDLGSRLTGPTNAISFVQLIGQKLCFIDFITDINRGLEHFAREIKERGYVYGGHFGGPDLVQASAQTGKTTMEFAYQLGIPLRPVRPHRVEDGILALRSILNRAWFDEKKCRVLVEALCQYHRKKNIQLSTLDKPVFHSEPAHDWACHPADSVRHCAMAYRQGMIHNQMDYDDPDEDMIMANSYSTSSVI